MDSRFLPAFAGMTGNDVMIEREPSLLSTTTVTPAVSVIPAEAGIHRPIQGVMNPEARDVEENGDPCSNVFLNDLHRPHAQESALKRAYEVWTCNLLAPSEGSA